MALTLMGVEARLNGVTLPLNWYQSDDGMAYVSLRELAEAIALPYVPNAECIVSGHYVAAIYSEDSGIVTLTVDEQNHVENGLVYNEDLLVNIRFLEALGARVQSTEDLLDIDLTEE